MQREWTYKVKKITWSKDLLSYWIKRLESKRSWTETSISIEQIKEDQSISNWETIKIRPDITIIGDVISQHNLRFGKRNIRTEKKAEKS